MKVALLGSGAVQDCIRKSTHHAADRDRDLLLAQLRACDASVASLECAVTTSSARWSRTPKSSYRRASTDLVTALGDARIGAVSLANDHVLDFEVEGLRDTLHALDDAGIACTGAGMDLYDAMRPAIIDVAGTRLGMIAFTDGEPAGSAWIGRPGVNSLHLKADAPQIDAIRALSHTARRAGAEIVIVALHRRVDSPDDDGQTIGDLACKALSVGAQMVVVFESWGVGRGGERLIAFGTGPDGHDDVVRTTLCGGTSIVLADLDRSGVLGLRRFRYGFTTRPWAESFSSSMPGASRRSIPCCR